MENQQAYMEAYYGKLPEFTDIENAFAGIMQKARKEGYKSNPNKYPENKVIEKTFAKIFGLKKMILYWVPSPVLNAYTVTISAYMLFGESKDFIEKRSDRGFYDTSGRSVLTVYAYTSMLEKAIDMTPQEILAVLLHELGHNFDYSRFHMLEFLSDTIMTLGAYKHEVDTHKMIEDMNDIKMDYLDKVKTDAEALYASPSARKKKAEEYNKALDNYINKGLFRRNLRLTFETLKSIPFCIPVQIYHLGLKKGELFADSFATSYGYGQDLMSGLEKLNITTVPLKEGKGLDVFRDLNNCMEEIFLGINEIHGTHQERCKACIKKLKADIASGDYPPELHDELVDQYEKMVARYKALLHTTPGDKLHITKLWRKVCNVIFGGAPNIAKFFKANRV